MEWEDTLPYEQRYRLHALFGKVFGSDDGKAVLAYLKAEFADRTSFHVNARKMSFFEGQRHVYLTCERRATQPYTPSSFEQGDLHAGPDDQP